MRLLYIFTFLLCLNSRAADIKLLKKENAGLGEVLQALAEKSGRQLQLKCKLPEDKRHWLFINASLDEALNTAANEFSLYYSLNEKFIILDKKRIPEPADKVYSIATNELFLNHLTQDPGLLETLTRGCSNVIFNKNKLSFSTSEEEFKALKTALTVLAYVDAKREMLVTLRFKNSPQFEAESFQELSIKNKGSVTSEVKGIPGKVNFEVSNVKCNATGECRYNFKLKWNELSWTQQFNDDSNKGQIEIAPGIYAEIFPTYILDANKTDAHNFPLSKLSPEGNVQDDAFNSVIPALRIKDEKIEQTVKRLEQLFKIPVSLNYCTELSRKEVLSDESTDLLETIGRLNLDAENIPQKEFLKYCTDNWGLNCNLQKGSIKLYKPEPKTLKRKSLSHQYLTRSLYRIPDLKWEEKKKEFINYRKKGFKDKNFKDFLNEVFFSFTYQIEILEVFEEQKTVLCSGNFDVPYTDTEASPFTIYEIEFSTEKAFRRFNFKEPSNLLKNSIAAMISSGEIIKAVNISILNKLGKIENKNFSLEYSKKSLTYLSKEERRKFTFLPGKPVYAEMRQQNGRVRVIFQQSLYEFKEPFPAQINFQDNEEDTQTASLKIKDKTLEEVRKTIKETYAKENFKPFIIRAGVDSSYLEVAAPIDDDPFAAPEEERKITHNRFKPLKHKFSLNLQNVSTKDLYYSLAFMLGLRIHIDSFAVIMAENPAIQCCGITNFYAVSKDIIKKLEWDSPPDETDDLVNDKKPKQDLFLPLAAGETMAYLNGVKRLIITSSEEKHKHIKAILKLLKKELKNVKLEELDIKIPEGSSFHKNNTIVSHAKNNILLSDKTANVNFYQSVYRREVIEQAGGSWIDKISLKDELKEKLKKLIIPEINFAAPNINTVLFHLSEHCQKLGFPDAAVNLIASVKEKDKAFSGNFKDLSVWKIISLIASHYELDIVTTNTFTMLTDRKFYIPPQEARLITLSQNINSRDKFLATLSDKTKWACLYLSENEMKQIVNKEKNESATGLNTVSRCRFKFLKNSSTLVIYGPVPLLDFLEKELIEKNIISRNKNLNFTLMKDNKEVYRFHQQVSINEAVKVKSKDGWEMSLTLNAENCELIFKSKNKPDFKEILKIDKNISVQLSEGFSIMLF